MALVLTIKGITGSPFAGVDNGQYLEYVYGSVTASGSYPTGGDILSFAGQDQIKSSGLPFQMQIWSQGTGVNSGFLYSYVLGTTPANGKMQVLTSGAAGSPHGDLTAGAYPAGITGDTIVFAASFIRV